MVKKIRTILLAAFLFINAIAFTTAESDIVDSMDFQGEAVELTLQEAVDIMLEGSPTIEKAKLQLEEAEVDYDNYKYDLRKADRIFGDKREDSIAYLQNIKLLELTGEYSYSNAQRNYQATVESEKAGIEESYYSLLQAEELVNINKTNLEVAKDLYEKTRKKFELGLVAKQEVLNSEMSYINAENQYKSAQNALTKARMMFNTKLGYDVMTKVTLTDKLEYKPFEDISIAEAVSQALVNRNEIKAAEFSYELQKINMDIIGKQYPDITFKYREQKVELEKALRDLEDARKSIEMEIRCNYLDVLEKQEEIKAGQKSVELAEEALRLSQLSYDVGMCTLTDVQKAQVALQQAKLGLSKSVLDYNLAVLKFEDSIGVGRTSISASMSSASMGQGLY